MSVFERRDPSRESDLDAGLERAGGYDAIVLGMGRFGSGIARQLAAHGQFVLGADFDPDVVARTNDKGIRMVYGDAEDPEFSTTLPLHKSRWVVCATPQADAQITLLKALRAHGYSGKIATTAYHERNVSRLEHAGSDIVLRPFAYAAKEAAEALLGRN